MPNEQVTVVLSGVGSQIQAQPSSLVRELGKPSLGISSTGALQVPSTSQADWRPLTGAI